MAYEGELNVVRAWLGCHQGLTIQQLKKSIKDVPWPKANFYHFGPNEGTRLDPRVPPIDGLLWKLRYLELMGDAWQKYGRWYLSSDQVRFDACARNKTALASRRAG